MTRPGALLDAGPLVALLDRTDVNHERAKAVISSCGVPLRTCEVVLAESAHLLSKLDRAAPADLLALGRALLYQIALRIDEHWLSI